MEYYLFDTNGDYVGMRGSLPSEDENLTAVEQTEATIDQMSTPFEHKLKDGQIIDGEPLPVEVPEVITPIQFWRSVYRLTGITEAMVKEQINQLVPEPPRVEILIMLEKATQFERNNPELIQMASLFNIDNETLNQIFINA